MSKTITKLAATLILALTIAGCSSGPSCEEKGGTTVATFSHFRPILVGKVTILQPVYIYTCEMPR